MESNHVKSINTDGRSNKRIKFASAKERSKRASADVYRSHKRKIGATSAATREEAVHNPHREINARKRQRSHHLPVGDDKSKAAILNISTDSRDEVATEVESPGETADLEISSSLANELDETADRNASEIFGKFHRKMWPLVRSLPEILHHANKIVDLMLAHMLSPESLPERPSNLEAAKDPSTAPRGYIMNHATLDILHLMAVLARDLRHEIHPFLHSILQRIVQDLLNPPPPPPESGKQPIPLDVTLVEASFRCMSYIFRYDADKILGEMESMRKYYGATLAARRELVRRLASETFAPLVRKLKSQNERQRHLKRVLKALVAATKGQTPTPHLKRTQEDAVDGISQFIFQIVRGVPGRLHSQGGPTVQFVLTYCAGSASNLEEAETGVQGNLLMSTALEFLYRLSRHIDEATTTSLVGILAGILKVSLAPESRKKSGFEPALNALRLFAKVAANNNVEGLSSENSDHTSRFFESLDKLFKQDCFPTLSLKVREEIISLLCPIWVSLPEERRLEKCFGSWLPMVFKANDKDEKNSKEHSLAVRNITAILSRDLIPHLQHQQILENVGSITLSAAARVAQFDKASALLTVFALATKHDDDSEVSSVGRLFFKSASAGYKVSSSVQQELMQTSLLRFNKKVWDQDSVESLAVALRCVPFVAALQHDGEEEKQKEENFSKAASWYTDVIVTAEDASLKMGKAVSHQDLVLIKALCFEGMSHLTRDFLAASENSSIVQKTIRQLIAPAEKLLYSHPSSLWAVRGVAAFVALLGEVEMVLNDKADETFDALLPNLSSPSHAFRLHTLEILARYPMKNFVTDHADLDLEGDLDEEPSYRPQNGDAGKRQGPVGRCDLISTLLDIERMKVQLTRERPLLALVSRVEVLGRSGTLPVVYAEAAAHHMLGLFYVKFAPLWPVAVRALVALAKGQENAAWPALETKLVSVMKPPFGSEVDLDAVHEDAKVLGYHDHLMACIRWEDSHGRSIAVFGDLAEVQDGEVYRHLTTDKATVMESVWDVAEKCQQLVAKHSRVIVPAFFGFLADQYFFYHSDDPSARELQLERGTTYSFDRSLLRTHELQKRLVCFLRVFAAVDGPQQLVKHDLLEQIFRCFLTHQDTQVVQLSLTCLLKFKPKHLVPYHELLAGILKKGNLRSALLNFQQAIEDGKVVDDHRKLLVPVISRMLFGRLSVRETRSGKDSPAAKRAAILSFLSTICHDDDEVFSFVYFMTRSFVPRDKVLKEVECYDVNEKLEILGSLDNIDSESLNLPSGVIEGFLHLLQAVVAQLGHRIKLYIPNIMSIVLALCEVAAVAKVADVSDTDAEIQKGEGQSSTDGLRRSAIRTLCYQRLSETFSMYSRSIEFERFGDQLWGAIGASVALLPEMVVKSDRVPALLHMLETLSSDASLLQLLCMHKAAVSAVIKCIASTSFTAVMTSVLTIIENLLDSAIESSESRSRAIVGSYVPLLMEQFASRFKSSDDTEMTSKLQPFKRTKPKLRQATWRRELRILCRVSELLENGDQSGIRDSSPVLEDLSKLLLPFLEPDSGTSDEDKLNVMGILRSTLTRVQPNTLTIVYEALSDIMGPHKGKPGIESISVRHEVAMLVSLVGEQNHELRDIAKKVAKMSAVNLKRVDEVDFEMVIPELNALCKDHDGCEWEVLAEYSALNLAPVVSICFHYLYNEDGVLSRASFNALKTLVYVASKHADTSQSWIKLIESLVVPPTRAGLQARSVAIRRFYILIVRETAKSFKNHDSPNLCGDLSTLVDEDNPDLDFFVGVTHVQMHRRGRAFQRLRKTLRESTQESAGFTSQSLSGFLLPLALHPAYESKTKAEETLALEGIATVGAIARHLPWNKYHNAIWSLLSSFDRHPEQERYLVGTLCAIIDAFNFDLIAKSNGSQGDDDYEKTSVWRALERRIVPKLEGLLTKEKSDKSGKKSKIIRPAVVLALMKLFQKFPTDFFESKLPHILAVMCDALRSRDSDARDLARTTMAKIVTGMDLKYLADVMRELSITLNEGYKLHVRAATIHTILQELLTIHGPVDPGVSLEPPVSTFDFSIPAIMDILQEDLFGEANERRESQDTNVRYVKEAGGSKSVHSIEMMCRILRFKPSEANKGDITKSSVHCVVSPLLERLRLSDVSASTIRKIKEILVRVVIGLSHNQSVTPEELFPFVFATIQPFIGSQQISAALDDEDDETDESLQVSGSRIAIKRASEAKAGKVVEWRPSTLNHAQSSKAAIDCQRKERQELRRVKDGASAPKLTGTARHGTLDASDTYNLNDPATISAVVFGLNLLNSCLRKLNLKDDETKLAALMDPFVPMLVACICNCKDNDVALVAMKCLMSFLRFHLPSLAKCSKSLGTQALIFLSSSGSSLNQNNDMTQACFRTLTYLINRDRASDDETGARPMVSGAEGEEVLAANATMPLNGEQMRVLLSFLIVSITESDQHNPALSLIKAILSRRFTSPEFYDLMESMLKLNVRSQKASLRQQSAGIFIRYLLDYPMGEERFEQHLKQIVANISYEYQDGRLSAIHMLTAVVEKLPDALLERHAQLLFLPQVLQLVNDESKECREAVSKCVSTLLRRSSLEVLQSFHNYTIRWCSGEGPMQVASLQVFGIFVDTCRDFVQSNDYTVQWIDRLQTLLQTPNTSDWEVPYFSLLCLEKFSKLEEAGKPLLLSGGDTELWNSIVERLIDAHPWIKLASCRIVQSLLNSTSTSTTADGPGIPKVLEETPGMLFEIIRNLCMQLNVEEEEQSGDSSEQAIKTLVLALPLVKKRPDLCFTSDSPHAGLRDPIAWVLRRLSSIAKPKGRQRRMAVYKCFAAFCSRCPEIVLTTEDNDDIKEDSSKKPGQLYMELMLEPLNRSDLEASNELNNPAVIHKASDQETAVMTESSLAKDVLQLIEEGCGDSPENFLLAYAAVKSRARDKKEDRKVQAKAEAVQDPMGAALKKTKKQQQERQRKKRRVDDRRRDRGAQRKRRTYAA